MAGLPRPGYAHLMKTICYLLVASLAVSGIARGADEKPKKPAFQYKSEGIEVPAATLSFHLKELSRAGLITFRQEGRFVYYAANFEHMAALMGFLTQNCCRGMPQACLTVMETALGRCCAPVQSKRKRSRS